MTASDELLLDPEYRKEKISTLQKESDAFTLLKRERTLTESEERAYKSITGEFARVFTLIISDHAQVEMPKGPFLLMHVPINKDREAKTTEV